MTIAQNIKRMRDLHEEYEEKIEEIQKKHLAVVKEKALIKLEKDKMAKRCTEIQAEIKAHEEKVQRQIDASMKKQRMGGRQEAAMMVKGKLTPWPEKNARPNPYLVKPPIYEENFNDRMAPQKSIKAHTKGIGGMGLHVKKPIVATASDDCHWKIWNLETQEFIMEGEGHKSWICCADFHPAGSHLITGGGDKSIKLWDFI